MAPSKRLVIENVGEVTGRTDVFAAHCAHSTYSVYDAHMEQRNPPRPAAPARRNLYVRAEDADVWDRAEQLAGESISQLVADRLRRYVAEREAEAEGFDRIVLEAVVEGDAPPGPWEREPRKIAFLGRWLVGEPVERRQPRPDLDERAVSDGDMHMYGVALTRRGKIAVLELDKAEGTEFGHSPHLKLYDSLDEARRGGIPNFIVALAAAALSVDLVDELDI
jgi:hypothetical protein